MTRWITKHQLRRAVRRRLLSLGFRRTSDSYSLPSELTNDQVLFVEKDGGEVIAGAPYVAKARVVAVVEGEARGPKIRVFKKKRRKGMRRTKGHRAMFTRVRIKEILL